jgi:XTP/dITP diphosphohydrolase
LTEHLLLATTNAGKIREIRNSLSGLRIEVLSLADRPSPPPFEETGDSFQENARGKSLHYGRGWRGISLGEDSGLSVEALDGKPGVHSARFAGPKSRDEDNIRKLLSMLEGLDRERRRARFVSCMVLSRGGMILFEITETVEGIILTGPQGDGGFGYDPVFYYPPLDRTFAQLSPEEKNRVSHRGQALVTLKRFLADRFGPR